jgi:hypothetical protein
MTHSAGFSMLVSGENAARTLALYLMIALYLAIPSLTFVAYRDWAKRWRQQLPPWRSCLGVGSMIMTLIIWIGTVYFGLIVFLHRPTGFSPDLWMVGSVFVSGLAAIGSLALKGRMRLAAFAGALLAAAPWMLDYVIGYLNGA